MENNSDLKDEVKAETPSADADELFEGLDESEPTAEYYDTDTGNEEEKAKTPMKEKLRRACKTIRGNMSPAVLAIPIFIAVLIGLTYGAFLNVSEISSLSYASSYLMNILISLALSALIFTTAAEASLSRRAFLIFIFVCVVLILPFIFIISPYLPRRAIFIGVSIYTAPFLVFIGIMLSKISVDQDHIVISRMWRMIAAAVIPLAILAMQPNVKEVLFFGCVVIAFMLLVTKKDIWGWLILITAFLSLYIFAGYRIVNSDYIMSRLAAVFSRGLYGADGSVIARQLLDDIFLNAPLFGSLGYEPFGYTADVWLARARNHDLVVILINYGWAAVIAALLVYAALFGILLYMTKKIEKPAFSHNVALFMTLTLVGKAAAALFSLALMDCGWFEFPFLSVNLGSLICDFAAVAIVAALFLKRPSPSSPRT